MPFLGNRPAENYISYDVQHFTTSATTSYTLDHAVTNENELRLVINNVVQQPGSSYAYSASGTSLTLTSATSATDTMYCVYLGKATSTVNPPSGSVGTTQLTNEAVTNAKVASSIITGQTAETSIATDDLILLSDTSASGALKKMTRANFVSGVGGTNTPSFAVQFSGSNLVITSNTVTLIPFNTVEIDTASGWTGSSDYKWTVPSGQAGKYLISLSGNGYTDSNNVQDMRLELHKNGSRVLMKQFYSFSADHRHQAEHLTHILSLSVGDYLQAKMLINGTNPKIRADANETFMSGFKLVE